MSGAVASIGDGASNLQFRSCNTFHVECFRNYHGPVFKIKSYDKVWKDFKKFQILGPVGMAMSGAVASIGGGHQISNSDHRNQPN